MSDHTPISIQLQNSDLAFIVDNDDCDLTQYHWRLQQNNTHLMYATRHRYARGKFNHEYAHRVIMERIVGRPLLRTERVDHIDRNPLNNKRDNLRIANASQNAANAPKHRDGSNLYRGVYRRNNGRFSTKICINRRIIQLGTYDTAEEARDVYQKAAEKYHGEFANSGE